MGRHVFVQRVERGRVGDQHLIAVTEGHRRFLTHPVHAGRPARYLVEMDELQRALHPSRYRLVDLFVGNRRIHRRVPDDDVLSAAIWSGWRQQRLIAAYSQRKAIVVCIGRYLRQLRQVTLSHKLSARFGRHPAAVAGQPEGIHLGLVETEATGAFQRKNIQGGNTHQPFSISSRSVS